jgi:glutathione peroxidase
MEPVRELKRRAASGIAGAMTKTTILFASLAMASAACTQRAAEPPAAAGTEEAKTVTIDHEMQTLLGDTVSLASYRGKALLIVNTASECGYTPQYAGLQELWERYEDRGLVVLGVPSHDFGGQESGSSEQIKTFCETQFGVGFPMLAKVHAKGPDIAPLYATLTTETPDGIRGEVRWNFTKFLVDTEGKPVARFEPKVEPLAPEVIDAIEKVLPQ